MCMPVYGYLHLDINVWLITHNTNCINVCAGMDVDPLLSLPTLYLGDDQARSQLVCQYVLIYMCFQKPRDINSDLLKT